MDSNQLVGVLCSIERCFEFDGWDVADVAVEAVLWGSAVDERPRSLSKAWMLAWGRTLACTTGVARLHVAGHRSAQTRRVPCS